MLLLFHAQYLDEGGYLVTSKAVVAWTLAEAYEEAVAIYAKGLPNGSLAAYVTIKEDTLGPFYPIHVVPLENG